MAEIFSPSPATRVKLLRLCSSALIFLSSCSSEMMWRSWASELPVKLLRTSQVRTRDTWLHTWLPAHGLQAHGVGVGGLDHVQDGGLAGLGLRDRSLVTHWDKQRSARDT